MSSIKKVILTGFFWSFVNQVSITGSGLLISGVLSRLIAPDQFGIIAMVALAIGFLNVIKDFGFGAALIQRKEVSDDEYSTVFWINLFIGIGLTLITFVLAPYIGGFFKEKKVELVTKALSFTFIINAIGIVWGNVLIKKIAFRQIFYRSFLSTIISGICAIILALKGYGLLALITQTYVMLIVNTYLNYLHVKWLPRLILKKEYLRGLMRFGLPLLADQSANYWVRNIDNLLVGRTFGKDTLAYYSKAYNLMLLPVQQLTSTLTKVLFPSFALIQNDVAQIANIYLKISRVIAFIIFPLMMALSALATPLILIVYGNNWLPVIPIFQVLSVLGTIQALAMLSGDIYVALGETKLMFKIGLFSKVAMITGIALGLYLGGLMGMVYGYCISSAIAFLPELYFVGSLINLGLKTILMNFLPYALLSGICFAITLCTRKFIHMNIVLDFILKFGAFCLIYLLLNYLFKTKSWTDLLAMIKSRGKSNNTAN